MAESNAAKTAIERARNLYPIHPMPPSGEELQYVIRKSDRDALLDLIDRFEVAGRETVLALDGLEGTWRNGNAPTYGMGVSNWDGPSLLRQILQQLGTISEGSRE